MTILRFQEVHRIPVSRTLGGIRWCIASMCVSKGVVRSVQGFCEVYGEVEDVYNLARYKYFCPLRRLSIGGRVCSLGVRGFSKVLRVLLRAYCGGPVLPIKKGGSGEGSNRRRNERGRKSTMWGLQVYISKSFCLRPRKGGCRSPLCNNDTYNSHEASP